MIEHIVQEIHKCLENDCQIAALALALTLPDTCGKAEYPSSKPRDRYKQWYSEHIEEPRKNLFNDPEPNNVIPSSTVVYKLRNSLFHESNPTVDEDETEVFESFNLIWESAKSTCRESITNISVCSEENGKDSGVLTIDIVSLCRTISAVALKFYRENTEKFNFDYRIVSTSDSVAQCFGFDNVLKL